MAGSKKAKKDFQKVKLKVGRQVQKGLNFTDTSFKAKKIVIREQVRENARDTREIYQASMNKLNSSNISTAVEGLNSLNRIVDLLSSDQRQNLIQRLGILSSNSDIQLRMGATTILNKTLEKFPLEQRQAFADKLILNLQSSLTSLDWSVKKDALELLNVLMRHIPEPIAKNYSVMENVMDLVSSTKEESTGRKLDMELKCNSDHLKLWGNVCGILTRLVQQIIKSFFSSGKRRVKTCTGLSIVPPIRWFGQKNFTNRVAIHLHGAKVAKDFIPVLLSMWSGVETCDSPKCSVQLKQDLFARISSVMLCLSEWADLLPESDLNGLPNQIVTFFKSRFPISFENNLCADTNLRLAKLMIVVHKGKEAPLNQSLFLELKKHEVLFDAKLTLDIASAAVIDTPDVLEYGNGLFFNKKTQQRRPFYNFYSSVVQKVKDNVHLNRMLVKMPQLICKIIIRYPEMCDDEVDFLENLHSYMFPAYIEGISTLSLATLEKVLRITHVKSRLALRLILDQRILNSLHLKIIIDLWNEAILSTEDITFTMDYMFRKMEEVKTFAMNEQHDFAKAAEIYVELVQLTTEFLITIYLDLDDTQMPRCGEQHSCQKHLYYYDELHGQSIHLSSGYLERRNMDRTLKRMLLGDEVIRSKGKELLIVLLKNWEDTKDTVISSLALMNLLFLTREAPEYDIYLKSLVNLTNQLFVCQFLLPVVDTEFLAFCNREFHLFGIKSVLVDLEQVMNANPDECDDRLHAAFVKSTKYLVEQNLRPKSGHHQDLIDDVIRMADGSEDSDDMSQNISVSN